MADGAAEIKNLGRLEIRELQPNEPGDRLADVIEVLAHEAEREHRETVIVERSCSQILGFVLTVVVAGHQMHVDRGHVARHLEALLQLQRAELLAPREASRLVLELRTIAFKRREHRLPDHVLCGHAQAGVELEVLVGLDGFVHLGTIGRGTARRPAEGRLHVRVEHGAHAGGHVVEHMGAQTRNEVHPRFFVPALVEFQFVLQFKHVTLRYLAQWSVSNRPNPSIRSLMPLARRACQ